MLLCCPSQAGVAPGWLLLPGFNPGVIVFPRRAPCKTTCCSDVQGYRAPGFPQLMAKRGGPELFCRLNFDCGKCAEQGWLRQGPAAQRGIKHSLKLCSCKILLVIFLILIHNTLCYPK